MSEIINDGQGIAFGLSAVNYHVVVCGVSEVRMFQRFRMEDDRGEGELSQQEERGEDHVFTSFWENIYVS